MGLTFNLFLQNALNLVVFSFLKKKGMKLIQISYKVRLCFCLPNLALQTGVAALGIFFIVMTKKFKLYKI